MATHVQGNHHLNSESALEFFCTEELCRSKHLCLTWVIPSDGGVVRNMMSTRDGNLALACSGVNRIGLVSMH